MKDLFENMGLETVPFPPTPSFKLARSHDPATSHDAAESITASHMEQVVLEKIEDFGSDGCISDQVLSALPHYGYSTVTARYKQLKEKGFVKVDDRKRKGKSGRGQLVMWASQFYTPNTSNGE
tara:strand:+ start:236 stop:604 length:369 start_codon:yes stop_codon:yes gene_type:complete